MERIKPYLYIAPAIILVSVFFITSAVYTIYSGFTDWNGLGEKVFIGLQNYQELFKDVNFQRSLINTLIWVVSGLIIPVCIPLILAVAISRTRFHNLYKNLFYFPNAISPTIGSLIITSLLSIYGLPKLFGLMGIESLDRYWLAIPYVNTFVMIGASVWQGIGTNLILFIVGLNNIPTEPIEAAQLDGASKFSLYTKIVFPLLKPTIVVVLLMSLVNSFKAFDSIWLMTGGGPYRTSETLALTMYKETFMNGNYGYGAAVATFLSIIVLFISFFYLKYTFSKEEKY
ncbi:hypothetical protein RV11_GL002808 [Enterococcus phoeniculicola]|jgi:ABC-type sugar transport system permease subunit|uniref:ABC transmembrane type-1 domain-containing protein n=1 Tax=Enterococcus phoeniculicola ATCC BAA-412 TaxID=1158610 RepID=R3TJS1_9ENTE|nr:sugar ABC transporter permease [Enterococcus phoeniculicola]EOL41669.1 hypothetical protein UC3_03234 [Enterococcus phoeniculicola ATCC BAA-412]EOT78837.1 hypothetical protein I589_00342 [Enterococcus phoeniculicola ATCC BAA-412]OJG72669.1 hypothetical protein RV11_GL002808 [Enterococcus phoeniculicola]